MQNISTTIATKLIRKLEDLNFGDDGILFRNFTTLVMTTTTASADYHTDASGPTDYVPYKLRPETYIVPVIFAIIFFVGIIGNGLLIFVVLTHKTLRNNAPNLYILNLSIGDFALILISVPFTSTIYTFESWPYGEVICKSTEFFRTLSVAISVYTLTALSADRYHAIVDPLGRYVGGKRPIIRKTLLICAIIWIVAISLAGIDAYYSYILVVSPNGNSGSEDNDSVETSASKGPDNKLPDLESTTQSNFLLNLIQALSNWLLYQRRVDLSKITSNLKPNEYTTNNILIHNFISNLSGPDQLSKFTAIKQYTEAYRPGILGDGGDETGKFKILVKKLLSALNLGKNEILIKFNDTTLLGANITNTIYRIARQLLPDQENLTRRFITDDSFGTIKMTWPNSSGHIDDSTHKINKSLEVSQTPSKYLNTIKVCFPFPEQYGERYKKAHTLAKFLLFLIIPLGIITVYYILMAKRLIKSTTDIPCESDRGDAKKSGCDNSFSDVGSVRRSSSRLSVIRSKRKPVQNHDDVAPGCGVKESRSTCPILTKTASFSNASISCSADSNVKDDKDDLPVPDKICGEDALLMIPTMNATTIVAINNRTAIAERYELGKPIEGGGSDPEQMVPLIRLNFNKSLFRNPKLMDNGGKPKLPDTPQKIKIYTSQNSLEKIYRTGTLRFKNFRTPNWMTATKGKSLRATFLRRGENKIKLRGRPSLSTSTVSGYSFYSKLHIKRPFNFKTLTQLSNVTAMDDRYANNVRLIKQMESRKKIAKMVLIFILIFLICWLPSHIFNVWFFFDPQALTRYNYFWHGLRIIGFVLSYVNSCMNPIALYFVSNTFKKHFNYYLTFKFLPCRRGSTYGKGTVKKASDVDLPLSLSNRTTSATGLIRQFTHHSTRDGSGFSAKKYVTTSLHRTPTYYEPSRKSSSTSSINLSRLLPLKVKTFTNIKPKTNCDCDLKNDQQLDTIYSLGSGSPPSQSDDFGASKDKR